MDDLLNILLVCFAIVFLKRKIFLNVFFAWLLSVLTILKELKTTSVYQVDRLDAVFVPFLKLALLRSCPMNLEGEGKGSRIGKMDVDIKGHFAPLSTNSETPIYRSLMTRVGLVSVFKVFHTSRYRYFESAFFSLGWRASSEA